MTRKEKKGKNNGKKAAAKTGKGKKHPYLKRTSKKSEEGFRVGGDKTTKNKRGERKQELVC